MSFTFRLSRDFFKDIQHWAENPFKHSNDRFYNLEIAITLDKKALQCLSGLGGGSFLTGYFCSYCAVRGNEKGCNAWFACVRCAMRGCQNCKHQPMLTADDLRFAVQLGQHDALRNIILYRLPSVSPGEKIQISMSAVRLKKVFAGRERLLHTVFGETEALQGMCTEFRNVFNNFHQIFKRLHSRASFHTQESIDSLQNTVDQFCSDYIEAFGLENVTNYLHDLHAGHVHFFLSQYNSLYTHCNIGLEASIGTTTSFLHRGTQHGGHAGRNFSSHKHTVVQAMRSRLTAKAVYTLGKLGEGEVGDFVQEMANSANE